MMDVEKRKLDFDELVTDTPTKKRTVASNRAEPTNIEVFLRIRPKDPQRISTAEYGITNQNKSIRLTAPNKADTRSYSFNHIFDSNTNNVQVFDNIGRKAIDRLLSGYSNLIFTYGITGSGKTHTITGHNMDGLLPSILHGLFNHNLMQNTNKYSVFVSYLENYTKDLYDLLQDADHNSNKENMNFRNHHIHNNNKRSHNSNKVALRVLPDGVDILDLMTIQITNAREGIQLIETGNLRRSKAHTKFNRNSSRSHVLFILDLFEGNKLRSRLCLVDLAGSESAKRNGFTMNDIGFGEACEINKSLSVLGRCIECIQHRDNGMKAPWREMVLTKLLWRYLCGKGYVTMIVTAHIVNEEYNETMRALEFAATTQNVEMNPVVNSVRPSTRHKSRICKTPKKTESKSTSISATPSKASREGSVEINFINSCGIDQLRKIAIESYKTALKSREMMRKLRNKKIAMIDDLLKSGKLSGMKGIEEETTEDMLNAMEVDDDNDKDSVLKQNMDKNNKEWEQKWSEMKNKHDNELNVKKKEYEVLSRKMTQYMMHLDEKRAQFKYVENAMNELKKKHTNESMQQNLKLKNAENNYKEEMENVKRSFEFKIVDLEHDLETKSNKMKQLEDTIDKVDATKISLESDNNTLNETLQKLKKEQLHQQEKEIQMEGMDRDKDMEYHQQERKRNEETEGLRNTNKELLIHNNKLQTTTSRYKSIINESEQKIEKYAHLNREYKEKIHSQHIHIGELDEKEKKMTFMMSGLKCEYKEKCDSFETIKQGLCKELDQRKRINEDAQNEILTLNQRLISKQNELKGNNKYKLQFEQLTQEFIQRGEELKNMKNMLNAVTKQSENQKLVYEKKIYTLNKDIEDHTQLFKDNKHANDEIIQQLKDSINTKESEYENHVQNIRNEWSSKYLSQQNITAQKEQIIEEMKRSVNKAQENNQDLMNKLNENNNWSEKYQKLFITFTHYTDSTKILETKYQHQCNQLRIFSHQMNDLKQSKHSLIQEMKRIQNEVKTGLKYTFSKIMDKQIAMISTKSSEIEHLQREQQQYQQRNCELMQTKEKEIEQWRSKYVENDVICNQLKQQYGILESKYNEGMNKQHTNEDQWRETMHNILEEKQQELEHIQHELEMKETELEELQRDISKQKEFHRLALQEADQEYLKEQQESKELYELNVQLEDKNKEIEEQLNGLNKERNALHQDIMRLNNNESALITQHRNELQHLEQRLSKQMQGQFEEKYQTQLTQQTRSLQERLTKLQLQSEHTSRRESRESGITISDIADRNKATRKRSREQMESDDEENIHSNPNKKRKITMNGDMVSMPIRGQEHDNDDDNGGDDENDHDMIFEDLEVNNHSNPHNINKSDSSSLQPQNLLSEYDEMDIAPISYQTEANQESGELSITITPQSNKRHSNTPALTPQQDVKLQNDDDDDDVEITQSDDNQTATAVSHETPDKPSNSVKSKHKPDRKYSELVSPAPSHLSEGDAPLPKPSKSKILKAIQKNIKPKITYNKSTPNNKSSALKPMKKKYLAMRTPATKEPRRRLTTQTFDINQQTPITKAGLRGLRCVDLRQKLKKHNLKSHGLKEVLVQTLFDHKNASKEENDDDVSDSNDNDIDIAIESEWIGKCIKEFDNRKYYKGIRIDGVEYSLGSEVFVINNEDDSNESNDWLAQIVELYENDEGGRFMGNAWFWRHSEISKAIKIKPYNSWKPDPNNEVFLSSGHTPDPNHISLINREKPKFKVFETKKEVENYKRNKNDDIGDIYFCQYIFNLKGHRLIRNNKIEVIAEGNEENIDCEDNKKSALRKRKRKTTSSKCESPKNNNKNKKPRNRGRRKRQKSAK